MAENKKKDGKYYLKKKYEEEVREHQALEKKYTEELAKNTELKEQMERSQNECHRLVVDKEELQQIVDKQASEISKLQADVHNEESRRIKESVEHKKLVDELFEHMGWFRRLIWRFDHAEKG